MSVVHLETKRVDKPWGRMDLWPGFEDPAPGGAPVGEVWFEHPDEPDPELLVKYLFTSEKLSIQVHPDDEGARARGYPRGKDEAWLILDAEPHAVIGIGMHETMTRDELRAAAEDGSIEEKLRWHPVKAGDFYYSPAGTVHAIGPGLRLIEIQQNVDLTYRLYDYGRPRELHLDDGIAVSNPVPYVAPHVPEQVAPGRRILAAGPKLTIERWTRTGALTLPDQPQIWIVPLAGRATADGQPLSAGGVWLADGGAGLELADGADLLLAYAGADRLDLG